VVVTDSFKSSFSQPIAVDGMGGDFAPDQIIQGVLAVAKKNIPIYLFGPSELLAQRLSFFDSTWQNYQITLVDAPEVIAMDEEPVQAVRKKKNSSLVQAVTSCAQGETQAVVSAGNSGALMAAATLLLGRVDGIDRPAIAGWLPSKKRHVLALDLGANPDCKPHYLYQFGILGDQYCKNVSNISSPRIGLLSNGTERGKGSQEVREAFALFEDSELNFFGNVEPSTLIENEVDVVVCDGFAGNILLKAFEASQTLLRDLLSQQIVLLGEKGKDEKYRGYEEFIQQWLNESMQLIEQQKTHELHGGGLLLGVKGTVVIAHGNAQAADLEQAIRLAAKSIESYVSS
jgi:glycerol-3-phosphate acyltransferase PlsX